MCGPPASIGMLLMALAIAGQTVIPLTGPQDEHTALKTALESAGRRVVIATESGRPSGLLELISGHGLAVGIDAKATDIALIREQFEQRKLSYCFFFDTPCYRKESSAARRAAGVSSTNGADLSLRDEFNQHPRKELFISNLRRDADGWYGSISIVLDPGLPDARVILSNRIDLGFRYERDSWKLADVNFNAM